MWSGRLDDKRDVRALYSIFLTICRYSQSHSDRFTVVAVRGDELAHAGAALSSMSTISPLSSGALYRGKTLRFWVAPCVSPPSISAFHVATESHSGILLHSKHCETGSKSSAFCEPEMEALT